jgi:hypothetical protein
MALCIGCHITHHHGHHELLGTPQEQILANLLLKFVVELYKVFSKMVSEQRKLVDV